MQNGWSPGRCRLLARVPGVFLSSLFAIVRRGPHINLCASVRHGQPQSLFSSDKSTQPPVTLPFTLRPLHLRSLSSPPPTSNILREKPIQRGAPLKCAVRDSLSLSLSPSITTHYSLFDLSLSLRNLTVQLKRNCDGELDLIQTQSSRKYSPTGISLPFFFLS